MTEKNKKTSYSLHKNVLVPVIHILFKFYKKRISPLFGNVCRFQPTCSEYAVQAIEKYGLFKGSWLAIKRIFRCNPFCKGGDDPVP